MLSRRDKLLVQPWEDRKFRDHRSKVNSALPVIDNSQPLSRPHVVTKWKKNQREQDRLHKIKSDNFSLLQRLNTIMKINRLDNHWVKPQPDFHHKVGLYFNVEPVNGKINSERMIQTFDMTDTFNYQRVKCYACQINKQKNDDLLKLDLYPQDQKSEKLDLPSIYKGM